MAKIEVTKYIRGTNEKLDEVLEDEEVWIIQGENGRRPIIANDEEDAVRQYKALFNHWKKKDEED